MRVIVAGSRGFDNYQLLCTKLDAILKGSKDIEIVSGAAPGADRLGERYAHEHGYPLTRYPAAWNVYGKSAGYMRNALMAEYADMAVVFWDGESRGSKHMIRCARDNDLPTPVIRYKEET